MKIPCMMMLLSAAMLVSCSGDRQDTAISPQFAANGSGPSVNSVSPNKAEKGTTVDVTVNGSGFSAGTQVTLALNGVASPYVVTNRTTYVSSKQLIANVTVGLEATSDLYDVVALTADGKKGIGTDLMTINDPSANWLLPLDATGLNVQSDGKYPTSDGYSLYANGVCGVHGLIYTPTASGSGDAYMQTNNSKYSDHKCASYPRKFKFVFPDGSSELAGIGTNLNILESSSFSIPVGATMKRGLNIGGSARCGAMKFKAIETQTGTPIPGDSVLVTRIDGGTWEVASQAPPNDRAYCDNTGESLHIQVRFRVVSLHPLP